MYGERNYGQAPQARGSIKRVVGCRVQYCTLVLRQPFCRLSVYPGSRLADLRQFEKLEHLGSSRSVHRLGASIERTYWQGGIPSPFPSRFPSRFPGIGKENEEGYRELARGKFPLVSLFQTLTVTLIVTLTLIHLPHPATILSHVPTWFVKSA